MTKRFSLAKFAAGIAKKSNFRNCESLKPINKLFEFTKIDDETVEVTFTDDWNKNSDSKFVKEEIELFTRKFIKMKKEEGIEEEKGVGRV